jgi:hypothetical protein
VTAYKTLATTEIEVYNSIFKALRENLLNE